MEGRRRASSSFAFPLHSPLLASPPDIIISLPSPKEKKAPSLRREKFLLSAKLPGYLLPSMEGAK